MKKGSVLALIVAIAIGGIYLGMAEKSDKQPSDPDPQGTATSSVIKVTSNLCCPSGSVPFEGAECTYDSTAQFCPEDCIAKKILHDDRATDTNEEKPCYSCDRKTCISDAPVQ